VKRAVVLLMLAWLGCRAVPPQSPGVSADLAVQGARAVVVARRAVTPKPPSPGVCSRCDGTGWIGDTASIRIKCDACKGTGKATCTSGTCKR